jgi:hypothetical protein
MLVRYSSGEGCLKASKVDSSTFAGQQEAEKQDLRRDLSFAAITFGMLGRQSYESCLCGCHVDSISDLQDIHAKVLGAIARSCWLARRFHNPHHAVFTASAALTS